MKRMIDSILVDRIRKENPLIPFSTKPSKKIFKDLFWYLFVLIYWFIVKCIWT